MHLVAARRHDLRAEGRPAAAGLELRRRREQRLAGDDVDVDPRLGGVQVLAGARALGRAFLGDAVLLGGEPGDGFGALAVGAHGGYPDGVLTTWGERGGIESSTEGNWCGYGKDMNNALKGKRVNARVELGGNRI